MLNYNFEYNHIRPLHHTIYILHMRDKSTAITHKKAQLSNSNILSAFMQIAK